MLMFSKQELHNQHGGGQNNLAVLKYSCRLQSK